MTVKLVAELGDIVQCELVILQTYRIFYWCSQQMLGIFFGLLYVTGWKYTWHMVLRSHHIVNNESVI